MLFVLKPSLLRNVGRLQVKFDPDNFVQRLFNLPFNWFIPHIH